MSGIRGSGKRETRGDRRTVKSRRKAYAAEEPPEDFFQFFDANLPDDALVTQNPPPPASRSDRDEAAVEQSRAVGSSDDSAPETADGTGIKRLLGRLKPNETNDVDDEFIAIDDVLGENDDSPDGHDLGAGKEGDAVSQLADIRRRGRTANTNPDPLPDDAADSADDEPDPRADTESEHHSSVGFLDSEAHPKIEPANPANGPDASHLVPDPAGGVDLPPGSSIPEPSTAEAQPESQPRPDIQPPAAEESPPAQSHLVGATAGEELLPSDFDGLVSSDAESEQPFDDNEPSNHGERRRTLRPIGAYPTAAQDGRTEPSGTDTPDSLDEADQPPEISPQLRDLVSELSNETPPGTPSENPFLKRSRLISEPDAVPDFSTDPFSDQVDLDPFSGPAGPADQTSVPAPVSPSWVAPALPLLDRAAAPPETAEQAEPQVRSEPAGLSTPSGQIEPAAIAEFLAQPEPAPPESSELAAVEEPPVMPEPNAVEEPAAAEETPVVPEPDAVEEPLIVPEPAAVEEPPVVPEPIAVEETPVVPEPAAPTEPEAVSALAAAHPLARAYRKDRPVAPANRKPRPRNDVPPPIDDVFSPIGSSMPTPAARPETPMADDDVPSINDLLPPEPSPIDDPGSPEPSPIDDLLSHEPSPIDAMGSASRSFESDDLFNYPPPGSTALPTAPTADDTAYWTMVDDVPDMDGSTPKNRADTDARGSWIPPALRGISPDAEEAGERLPRRRG